MAKSRKSRALKALKVDIALQEFLAMPEAPSVEARAQYSPEVPLATISNSGSSVIDAEVVDESSTETGPNARDGSGAGSDSDSDSDYLPDDNDEDLCDYASSDDEMEVDSAEGNDDGDAPTIDWQLSSPWADAADGKSPLSRDQLAFGWISSHATLQEGHAVHETLSVPANWLRAVGRFADTLSDGTVIRMASLADTISDFVNWLVRGFQTQRDGKDEDAFWVTMNIGDLLLLAVDWEVTQLAEQCCDRIFMFCTLNFGTPDFCYRLVAIYNRLWDDRARYLPIHIAVIWARHPDLGKWLESQLLFITTDPSFWLDYSNYKQIYNMTVINHDLNDNGPGLARWIEETQSHNLIRAVLSDEWENFPPPWTRYMFQGDFVNARNLQEWIRDRLKIGITNDPRELSVADVSNESVG